jgi:hypothetical protein
MDDMVLHTVNGTNNPVEHCLNMHLLDWPSAPREHRLNEMKSAYNAANA